MKKLAKAAVAAVLGYQVRRLQKKNSFRVVAVTGSIGKTSTKLAIAQMLQAGFRVRYQEGNYNDLVSVPLVFFGQQMPSLFNPLDWLAVFWRNQVQLAKPYPYDVVVLELGTNGPGQIGQFKRYLKIEVGVISAITPEHMEFFGGLDAVAAEEMTISQFSSLILVNKDLCDVKYLKELPELLTYGIKNPADYSLDSKELNLADAAKDKSQAEQYSLLAAAAVALKLGMEPTDISKSIKNIKPVPGRMQRLAGLNGSTIIDDSYNASPAAVKLALDALYAIKAPQKIALLGNMNELGDASSTAHRDIGNYCDPKQLALVVTLGPAANQYLAPAAEAKGCTVKAFDSPYAAGDYLKMQLQPGTVVLVKGSQNKVYAEEAIKSLLTNPADTAKLVRQTPNWLKIKQKAFKG